MITYWIITVVSFELQIKSRIGKEKSPMEKRKQKIKPKSLTQKKNGNHHGAMEMVSSQKFRKQKKELNPPWISMLHGQVIRNRKLIKKLP